MIGYKAYSCKQGKNIGFHKHQTGLFTMQLMSHLGSCVRNLFYLVK